jgi:hypothetical protein
MIDLYEFDQHSLLLRESWLRHRGPKKSGCDTWGLCGDVTVSPWADDPSALHGDLVIADLNECGLYNVMKRKSIWQLMP